MSKSKVVLVGCGRIAKKHAALLGEGQISGARLAAVCDLIPARAIELSRQYSVPWYRDIDTMLETVEPDLVSVLTPSGLHAIHALHLSLYQVPLLVEKPLALTLEDVDNVVNVYQKCGTKLGEVKQNRYNVAVRYLKDALDSGRLGTPRLASVRVWWSRDAAYYEDWHGRWDMAGGVLANQAIHYVDLLWWLLGDVRRVSAFATYDGYTQLETGLVATLEFESGVIGTLEATTLTRPRDLEGSLAVLGSRGIVELGGFAANKIRRWEFDVEEPGDAAIRGQGENPPDVYGFGHLKLYEDVVGCLKAGGEFPVNGQEARKSLEIVHAIYEAIETNRVVELGGEYPHSRLGK